MKRLIVPGVGGNEAQHWQSWLQQVLPDTEQVKQCNWHQPILQQWTAQLAHVLQQQDKPVQIVAHSFGCLTTVATLKQYPVLAHRVHSLILVAPANPERFSTTGLRQPDQTGIAYVLPNAFAGSALQVPSLLIASQTDPWLDFEAAKILASQWQSTLVDLGNAGHINVASGFGPWPQLLPYLDFADTRFLKPDFMPDSSPVSVPQQQTKQPLAPRPLLSPSIRMRNFSPTKQFRLSHSF